MDNYTIFTKTAKGLGEALGKTKNLSRDHRKILKEIDGKASFENLVEQTGIDEAKLGPVISKLLAEDYIREFGSSAPPGTGATGETVFGLTMPARIEVANSQLTIGDFFRAMEQPRAQGGSDVASLDFKGLSIPDAESARKAREEQVAQIEQTRRAIEDEARRITEQMQQQAAESARRETERQARAAADQARLEAEAKARQEAEAARQQAEAARQQALLQEQARARQEAEEKARRDVEERARKEAEEAQRQARIKAEQEARIKAEQEARRLAEEAARREEQERQRREAEERARQQAEDDARKQAEAERQARIKADEEARLAAEEQARLKAEAEARRAAEEQARHEAQEQARLKAQEDARLAAAARAREEAEAQARREAEEEARRQEEAARRKAEEEAQKQAQEQARAKAWEAARRAAEELAKREAEAQAKVEAERQARIRAEEEARLAAEEQARMKAEEEARQAAEEQARREAQERARLQAEEEARRAAEEKAQREAEEQARKEARERAKQEAEEAARLKAEEKAREKAEAKARKEAEAQAKRDAKEKAKQAVEEAARLKAEEAARLKAEKQAAKEAEKAAKDMARAAASAAARVEPTVGNNTDIAAEHTALPSQDDTIQPALENVAPASGGGVRITLPFSLGKLVRVGTMAVAALAVAGLALVHVMPFTARLAQLQKEASTQFGQPVNIGSLNLALFPQPHWRMQAVVIGEDKQIVIEQVKARTSLGSLLAGAMQLKSIELVSPAIDEEGLGWILFGTSSGTSSGSTWDADSLKASDIRLRMQQVRLPAFDGSAEFDDKSGWRKIVLNAAAEKLHIDLHRTDAKLQFELTANDLVLPFGVTQGFDSFNASGSMARDGLEIDKFTGVVYDGTLSGSALLRWKQGWSLKGEAQARRFAPAKLVPTLVQGGAVDGNIKFTMQADEAARLFAAPQARGSFNASNGTLLGIDMASQIMGQVGSGRTAFNEINGDFTLDGGKLKLTRMHMAAGLLSAAGDAAMDADGKLSGLFNTDLRTATRQAHGSLRLGGTAEAPQFGR